MDREKCALLSREYRFAGANIELAGRRPRERFRRADTGPAPASRIETYVLDVCVDLFQARSGLHSDFEDLWGRSELTRLWGVPARCLAPIDQLIDICVQFHVEATVLYYIELGKDLTLMKLLEIAELAHLYLADPMDQEELQQRIEALGCRESLYYALWHARFLYSSRVPQELVDRIGEGCDERALTTFGRLDGAEQTWSRSFLERLFTHQHTATNAGASSVPGPRAVL